MTLTEAQKRSDATPEEERKIFGMPVRIRSWMPDNQISFAQDGVEVARIMIEKEK